MIYEYIKTAFGVLTGILTHKTLLMIALIAIAFYVLWVTLSLIFSFEKRFDKNARKIYAIVNGIGVDKTNLYQVNKLVSKMPAAFARGWNTYRYKNSGLPSEYIKREDCLDLELSGGVFNRNRSLMKTCIHSVFVFLLIFCIAMLGKEDVITGYLLAESCIIPFIFLGLARITYYIYTGIRQYQYRMAVDSFYELMKELDNLSISQNRAKEKNVSEPIVKNVEESKIIKKEDPVSSVSIEKDEDAPTIKESETEPVKKRGRPKLEFPVGEPIIIRTDKEFEAALERAEKLMRKSEQQLSPTQAKRVEKNLKELINAMNKYREEE